MAEDNLRDKAVSGVLWSSVGRFGAIALNFLSNLVLARLLMPDDFGAIGMLYVFIAISNEFVLAGFGSALLQKKEPTQLDYSSVFWWNLAASLVFYLILFFCAPAIARFYALPELCLLLRVLSLSMVILAFTLVPSFWLQKQFRFRELSMRQLVATGVGTVVGIVMALLGCGVWSLVVSNLLGSLAGVMLLWRVSAWRPNRSFSLASLKELFRFGGLMALSSFMESAYANLQNLIIGKRYTASDLGYYTQAQKLENVPVSTFAQIVNQVSFPLFAALQDDLERLRETMRRNSKTTCYVVFPAMALLFIIAHPLITLLYGAKWDAAAPYFQLLCLYGMVFPLDALNTCVIKALGRSGVYFVSRLALRVLGIGLLFAGVRFGIWGLLAAVVTMEYLCLVADGIINGRLIGYGLLAQIRDVGGYFLMAALLALGVYWAGGQLSWHPYLVMVVEVIVYAALFVLLSKLFRLEGYATCREIVIQKFVHKSLKP